jgi:hypothetical protein
MTYVYLDPDGLQNLINGLKAYADTILSNKEAVSGSNAFHCYPADLMNFDAKLGAAQSALEDESKDLQVRLDSAKAANESGLTSTDADGSIAYYIPDDAQDTAENVRTSNSLESVIQAREDAEFLDAYSKEGYTKEIWEELLASIKAHQDDPAYANVLLNRTGRENLLDIPTRIASHSQGDSAEEEVSDALGHVLASASSMWSADKAKEYANGFINDIEKNGGRFNNLNRMLMASREIDIDGDGTNETVGLKYNDNFLLTLASRLEDYKIPLESRTTNPELLDTSLTGLVHAMSGNPGTANKWLQVHDADGKLDQTATEERVQQLMSKTLLAGPDGQGLARGWTDDWMNIAAQTAVTSVNSDSNLQDNGSGEATVTASILNEVGESGDRIELSPSSRNTAAIVFSAYPYGFQESTQRVFSWMVLRAALLKIWRNRRRQKMIMTIAKVSPQMA